jgi:hypothetical protein
MSATKADMAERLIRLFESIDAAKASPYRKVSDVTGLTTEFTPDMIGMAASWLASARLSARSDRLPSPQALS